MKFQKGFTLIEMMIAVAIVATLMMFAIPSYQAYVARSDRAAVKADLMTAASILERRKSQNFSYIGSGSTGVLPVRSPMDSVTGEHKYNIGLTMWKADGTVSTDNADPTVRYELSAVSTTRFSGPQEALKINEVGQKCYRAGSNTCTLGTDPTWP